MSLPQRTRESVELDASPIWSGAKPELPVVFESLMCNQTHSRTPKTLEIPYHWNSILRKKAGIWNWRQLCREQQHCVSHRSMCVGTSLPTWPHDLLPVNYYVYSYSLTIADWTDVDFLVQDGGGLLSSSSRAEAYRCVAVLLDDFTMHWTNSDCNERSVIIWWAFVALFYW